MKFAVIRTCVIAIFLPVVLWGCANPEAPSAQLIQQSEKNVEQGGGGSQKIDRSAFGRSHRYSCDNGHEFTISFSKNLKKARLSFHGSEKAEILANNAIGDGVSYGNSRFVYEEHHAGTTLTVNRSAGREETTTICRDKKNLSKKGAAR